MKQANRITTVMWMLGWLVSLRAVYAQADSPQPTPAPTLIVSATIEDATEPVASVAGQPLTISDLLKDYQRAFETKNRTLYRQLFVRTPQENLRDFEKFTEVASNIQLKIDPSAPPEPQTDRHTLVLTHQFTFSDPSGQRITISSKIRMVLRKINNIWKIEQARRAR